MDTPTIKLGLTRYAQFVIVTPRGNLDTARLYNLTVNGQLDVITLSPHCAYIPILNTRAKTLCLLL